MFNPAIFGLNATVPRITDPVARETLCDIWQVVQPTLLPRLAQEGFSYSDHYGDTVWWHAEAGDGVWDRWYLQTHSLWLVWRALCAGGRRQPRWPADPFALLPELQQEAVELWYHWACLHAGTPVYPSTQQVSLALQHWLRRFDQFKDVDLKFDITLRPSLADGLQLGQANMVRHWPMLLQAVTQRQWLPLRVMLYTTSAPQPWRSLALLLISKQGERLCCFDPLARRNLELWRNGEHFMLGADNDEHRLHSFYPLASPIAALKPSLWQRCWYAMGRR